VHRTSTSHSQPSSLLADARPGVPLPLVSSQLWIKTAGCYRCPPAEGEIHWIRVFELSSELLQSNRGISGMP